MCECVCVCALVCVRMWRKYEDGGASLSFGSPCEERGLAMGTCVCVCVHEKDGSSSFTFFDAEECG